MKKYLNLNVIYGVMGIIVLVAIFLPQFIEFRKLVESGISYIENDKGNYFSNASSIEGEFSVNIDLTNLESNKGNVLFDDGENQIHVSKVLDLDSGYKIIFRSRGTYSLGGATLVSGVVQTNHNNELQAKARVTFKEDTVSLKPIRSSGLDYLDGDEFGFSFVPMIDEMNRMSEVRKLKVTVSNLYVNILAKKPQN